MLISDFTLGLERVKEEANEVVLEDAGIGDDRDPRSASGSESKPVLPAAELKAAKRASQHR